MLREQGIVEKIASQRAVVRIQPSSACAGCEARGACQVHGDKKLLVDVKNDLEAKVGDTVEISMPSGSVLKVSLLVYALPILGLILGALSGSVWAGAFHTPSTPASLIGGGAGLAVSVMVLRYFDRSVRSKPDYSPQMTRVFKKPEGPLPCDDNR
jgi:sigma-E factor negative regulatory protein RseC